VPVGPIVVPSNPRTIDVGVKQICTYARLKVPFSSTTTRRTIKYALENPGDLSDYKAEGITYEDTEDRFVIALAKLVSVGKAKITA
jgi:hypothetical protein